MTINPIFLRPSGNDYYKHNVVGPIVNRYGGAYWPLDDVLRSDTNVVKDFCGRYDGAVSGVTYTNQVTVTGTLSPDATGTYTVAGVSAGLPYYSLGSSYYLYYLSGTSFRLSPTLGVNSGPRWSKGGAFSFFGDYAPSAEVSGTATVAAVPASGVYRFDASGVTLGVDGPSLCGEVSRAAAFATNGSLVTPSFSPLNGKSAFSFCFWAKVTTGFPNGMLAELSANLNSNNGSFYCALNSNNSIDLSVRIGSEKRWRTNTALTVGSWTHVACVFDTNAAERFNYYKNGVKIDSTLSLDQAHNTTLGNHPLYFASRGAASIFLTGQLSHAFVIPAALDAEVWRTLYLTATRG